MQPYQIPDDDEIIYTFKDLADKTGLTVTTLKWYQQMKLIKAIGLRGPRRRTAVFDVTALERLKQIVYLRKNRRLNYKEIVELMAEGGPK